ncbi:MAG TPA: hypothetical protein VGJ02_01450 [Pyrinomonadaceae bacterium]
MPNTFTGRTKTFVVLSRGSETELVVGTAPNLISVRIVLSVIVPKANRANLITALFFKRQLVAARAFKFH